MLDVQKPKLRAADLKLITISHGSHSGRGHSLCIMEAVAWVAGEPHSDHPACVSPIIAAFLRSWNDALPDDATRVRLLSPLIKKLPGTATGTAHEDRRAWMIIDWLIREFTPAWLRLAKLNEHAIAVETLPEIKDAASVATAMPIIGIAKSAAAAARDAARAAAGAALKPTTEQLQQSAVKLIERLIAVSEGK